MRFVKTFEESVLHNPDNQFCVKVIYKRTMHVDIDIPQYKIKSTLQDYIDSQPKRIELYWSSAPVFKVIVKDLAQQNLTHFERLELLILRCPYLYGYRFNPRNNTERNNENT
jgi:hypothetical protein